MFVRTATPRRIGAHQIIGTDDNRRRKAQAAPPLNGHAIHTLQGSSMRSVATTETLICRNIRDRCILQRQTTKTQVTNHPTAPPPWVPLGPPGARFWPAAIDSKHVSYRHSLTINRLRVSTVSVMVGFVGISGERIRSDTACAHWTCPHWLEPKPSKVGLLVGLARAGYEYVVAWREGEGGRPQMGTIFGLINHHLDLDLYLSLPATATCF